MAIKRNSKNRKAGISKIRGRRKKIKNNTHSKYPGYCHGAKETTRRKRQIEEGKLQCT